MRFYRYRMSFFCKWVRINGYISVQRERKTTKHDITDIPVNLTGIQSHPPPKKNQENFGPYPPETSSPLSDQENVTGACLAGYICLLDYTYICNMGGADIFLVRGE